ncbi:MAG: glutaminyl-tRNA synthase (glutamine-hydrolyzing) subunit B [Candidatus Ryanbacteria bacterium RIFCSPHIGHO2_12_FULL_47_12b]|uniref:Aspartyl/glutamyl-tRNA(Asn/Gln) amidotransferase subunit B n=1 Tax=Candidatus Ryanbacteria bacterium RIFCSPLOWO2_12_FULL_47_9c TaxID=1802131 RepID=A0A1G2H3D7_9BACT|nr:MAG: Aspartyl/glutamyl-tRNA(Asn/Gln) amidotransferase subunit B [Parcubacteria group bacterium GW2011_GWA2_47_10b]OGZ53219.1 MAG: glutaminyl-tRNA synthase (glutamine-hydrolyzing) subunit B [Candidatus Ryanbacteria bacterium RIFCSPHIGHO2_12_FULL_47_12b]OGZ56830.1 MAG: glutaminyl-tRNA synthase (glutamine-hydrolyzing) subunit B [Candidatus Ryanbacteria bacterium RIFCSPLOWO2_12_FULL_47_9c]
MDYEPVIGLEIHAELATTSKMFCRCKNDPDETEPNKNICPICLAHPGTLPVANEDAIRKVIAVGLALGAEIPDKSQFDRKNYFYPDLPKGYQISQYEHPLTRSGFITLASGKKVRITRVHLEEDTGSLLHDKSGNTLVDFNRAGIPLMELVTEPDLRSAAESREAAEELQLIFQYVGVSRARMQKGEMRVEANVSVRPKGATEFGTKVELKNINSFKFVEKAIESEIKRQIEILKAGGTVTQETRGWDEAKQETFLQRSKESAHDYRYFPEPDLPPLDVAHIREELKHHLPELPAQKRSRFKEQYGLDGEAIELFVRDKKMAEFFEETVSELQEWLASDGKATKPRDAYKLVRNYMLSDLSRALDEKGVALDDMKVDPKNFAELITLVAEKKISSRGAKDLLSHMVKLGGDPHEIAKDKDLFQTSDSGELEAIVKKVIENNASAVAEYKAGKQNALQFLVGQAMKVSKGKGDPEVIRRLLINELSW